MSYRFEHDGGMSAVLDKTIRELHSVIGNAVTDGKFIVFGAGSTQLLNAAILSLSPEDSLPPANVVASAPFYPVCPHLLCFNCLEHVYFCIHF